MQIYNISYPGSPDDDMMMDDIYRAGSIFHSSTLPLFHSSTPLQPFARSRAHTPQGFMEVANESSAWPHGFVYQRREEYLRFNDDTGDDNGPPKKIRRTENINKAITVAFWK
eukprot:GHVU01031080.1.p2 GENE.GHVU01031080.1~~GHVU01031080.1.p2  ORF type:complete len:112 (-),score=14.75 GHVU01031080.1:857-1192(-)